MRKPISLEHALQASSIVILFTFAVCANCPVASAMPMFARRYGVPCSTCHTSPPRLNETGYRFRAAGFRMPEELGKNVETSNKLTDHIGFRLQPRLVVDALINRSGEGERT